MESFSNFATEPVNLTWLSLQINKLKDISALSELVNLNSLHIDKNKISDVSGLVKLSKLVSLYAFHNQITDISSITAVGANTMIDARFQSINLAEVDEEMTSSISLATLSSLSMEIDWVTEGTLIENQLKWIHVGENKLDFNGGGISSSGAQVYFSGTVTQEVSRTRYIKELFPDPNLAKAVAEIFMRTIDDPISIKNELNSYSEVIDFSNKQIIKLDGMEYFEKTTRINFNGNSIVDISKLAHLKLMTYCTLDNNKISDISSLTKLSAEPRLKILEIENQTLELEPGVAGNESIFKLSTLEGLPLKLVFQDEGT